MPCLARTILAQLFHHITQCRHSRHSLSGIHPEFDQMDSRYLPAGMTEEGWRLICFWEIKGKRPLFPMSFIRFCYQGSKR
jgi:hypothetical protein